MATEDKTYCGSEERDGGDITNADIKNMAERLGLAEQDIIDAIEKVGLNLRKVEQYFHDKENSY